MCFKLLKQVLIAMIIFFSLAKSGFCVGSGAYRLEVPDAEAMGKGTAFVAEADNPSAVFYNPAGLTQIKGGNHFTLGYAVIQPRMDYKDSSGDVTQMRRQSFVIPHMYFVSDFGMKKFVFGIGGTSSWGLGTYWAGDSFSKYVATKSDLNMMDPTLVAACQVNEQLSLGVGVDYDFSKVNKKKKLIQPGGADADFQLKGNTDGWGYRISGLYVINERHKMGLQYRSPIKEKYKGKIYMDQLNSAGLNYQAIFGGQSYSTDISSESTLPQSVVLGYSYRPANRWTLNLDVEWMDWSSVEQEYIMYNSETNATRLAILNSGNPIARDWESVFSIGAGAEYAINERLRLRGGYFYHQTPVPEATFDTSLPDSDSHSATAGFGYNINDNATIDMSYAAMFFKERSIDNAVGASSGASIDGEYKNFTNIVMMTFGYNF